MYDMDDETKSDVLRQVLMDELKVIHECVKDLPVIKSELRHLKTMVDEIQNDLRHFRQQVSS